MFLAFDDDGRGGGGTVTHRLQNSRCFQSERDTWSWLNTAELRRDWRFTFEELEEKDNNLSVSRLLSSLLYKIYVWMISLTQ